MDADGGQPEPLETPQSAPRFKGRSVWRTALGILALVLLAFVPMIRLALFETDHQFANLGGMVFGILATFVGWLWILVQPGLRWPIRASIFLFPFVACGLFVQLFECVGVTGETWPVFRMRGSVSRPISASRSVPSGSSAGRKKLAGVSSFQFLGSDRNGIVHSPSFAVDWDRNPPKLLWKQSIGEGWASFAVHDGLAITLEQIEADEAVTALDIETGEIVWQYISPGRHANALGGVGPRATPTISERNVYSQTAVGKVLCNRVDSGELLWQVDLLKLTGLDQESSEKVIQWGRSGSPLVYDDVVVVPLGGQKESAEPKTLIAFDRNSGEIRWKGGPHQISYSSPILATLCGVRQIVSVNEGNASGHDPSDGHVLWTTSWPSNSAGDACASQPVIMEPNRVMLGKGYALGSKVFEVEWSEAGRSSDPYDAASWSVSDVWSNTKILKTKFTSAIAMSGFLYGLSDGVLECVRPEDGTRVWRGKRYGQGQSLVVNDHVLVTAEDGRIALIATEQIEGAVPGTVVAELPVIEGITWNVPTVAGPFLLIRNGEYAACLKCERTDRSEMAP